MMEVSPEYQSKWSVAVCQWGNWSNTSPRDPFSLKYSLSMHRNWRWSEDHKKVPVLRREMVSEMGKSIWSIILGYFFVGINVNCIVHMSIKDKLIRSDPIRLTPLLISPWILKLRAQYFGIPDQTSMSMNPYPDQAHHNRPEFIRACSTGTITGPWSMGLNLKTSENSNYVAHCFAEVSPNYSFLTQYYILIKNHIRKSKCN